MTLSRFLRDYLYIPLGGNRYGVARRHLNLMATMLLGGLWHGAGWTFVVWGGLHGFYLVLNHAWQTLHRQLGFGGRVPSGWRRGIARAITFLAVLVGWVFFRADSFTAAFRVLAGLVGLHGVVLPQQWALQWPALLVQGLASAGVDFGNAGTFAGLSSVAWIAGLLGIAFLAPNAQEFATRFWRADATRRTGTEIVLGISLGLGALAAIASMNRVSEFLYFQF